MGMVLNDNDNALENKMGIIMVAIMIMMMVDDCVVLPDKD